ncbi:mRNA-binding ribosome synthesis protein nop7 [Clathrus columnatus]|uniref:Pescadillo homolog n=1 Tax=Clathrus columnatus TaxID=1419009 RepID=A0AAV5A679_9AGAM|nr:mRNA-binding ribosome synthesis protein nop7 [Clathrus columnatus]
MGRLRQKGKAGAAKAYVTRSQAVKKLQCSLADFRRLCILKGIFPRDPRHRKKANKGSSAPASFYYSKDIAYLAHEPVLRKLREHKAFAKKLSRALGRGEWSSAKSLEDHKPVYTLDHIIKERYPTFIDALRDIDDALCLVTLFANLPSNSRIPPALVEVCSRLSYEWQLYVMRSQTLRKVFLSIKGIYYQAEVLNQPITWLVPYMFTQNVPSDVDIRVMLTFLELYQTLLGFVFFKLYTDIGLVYPPPMDISKDEAAAGVGAFSLQTKTATIPETVSKKDVVEVAGKKISGKDVRKTIKSIEASTSNMTNSEDIPEAVANEKDDFDKNDIMADDDFVPQPSKTQSDENIPIALPTLKSLMEQSSSINTQLFSPYTFYLSRETPRPLMEFIVRSFGGRIGWPVSQGSGSPVQEDDESITHIIVDRPVQQQQTQDQSQDQTFPHVEETEERRRLRLRRKYVQPQWVVDCINKGKILPEGPYEQGKTLPPHLSPFGMEDGAYNPEEAMEAEGEGEPVSSDEEDEPVLVDEDNRVDIPEDVDTGDASALRAAELKAEAAGVDYDTFEKAVKKKQKKRQAKDQVSDTPPAPEADMRKMLLSGKKRKLYEKMKYTEQKKVQEKETLTKRREQLKKEKKKKTSST